MPKAGAVETSGVVIELLPNAMFKIELDNAHHVLAHVDEGSQKNFVRIQCGDRVRVQLSPYDLSRGRITRRIG